MAGVLYIMRSKECPDAFFRWELHRIARSEPKCPHCNEGFNHNEIAARMHCEDPFSVGPAWHVECLTQAIEQGVFDDSTFEMPQKGRN